MNDRWLIDAVEQLQHNAVVQLFEYCLHLERNQVRPANPLTDATYNQAALTNEALLGKKRLWRSFAANYVTTGWSSHEMYDIHGHVGFAWGARREVLAACPLYDRALIGGADHVIAHAAAGQIPHTCIVKGFGDNLDEVLAWSWKFHRVVERSLGYVPGDLYHLWHGDINKRQYLQRIQGFAGAVRDIRHRDRHNLYLAGGRDTYVKRYYRDREALEVFYEDFGDFDAGFEVDMGYTLDEFLQECPAYLAEDPSASADTAPVLQGMPVHFS